MFGQTQLSTGKLSASASRLFRYEVVGLRQTSETENYKFGIRNSGSVFITVPYSRMNAEMQRISRLGGKIVNIEPLTFGIYDPSVIPYRGGSRR
ncbi:MULTISPECIES: phycobilisome linker polypeptide [Calothrix]|uniref:Phycobilisome linker polypeptide n=2 Tax=Calothrix TaxID=1186 RepID=A0ABR8AHB1_9CYAN|nr:MULTISPECIES: phycobilisome linker polypeptide [Calothrix]MBD2199416.1 phycobilisome linker polypeptide [Calothrix parietina FACHB-288]MBD2228217.1 phycobilisome linker polypeptide [Calothrix anomala FACHB-343]